MVLNTNCPGGKPLKILLIMPYAGIHRLEIASLRMSFREAPLTLTTLAALVPPELNAEIKLADENVETIPLDEKFDLVGISVITGTAPRAYELAAHFRKMGSTVVLGGVHVTLLPDEARQHADSIVTGFAELAWPELLNNFANKKLKPEYNGGKGSFENIPAARRDLQNKFGYMTGNTVMATRGCRSNCDFCAVPAANFGWHKRPVGEVIDEIRGIGAKRIAFNDVNLLDDRDYAKELLTELIPLKKVWGGLCTSKVAEDDELLELLEKSGCICMLIGFESIANEALTSINKGFNRPGHYKMLMEKFHDKNIVIIGCFIFGFDHETTDVFKQTVDAVHDIKIDIPRYAIYTPYPKTQAYQRLKSEGRLLHENWKYYDTQHVVFQPKNMSVLQLDEGFRWAWRKTFSYGSILRRTITSGKNFMVTFAGNMAYRIYLKRLQRETDRLSDLEGVKSCVYS